MKKLLLIVLVALVSCTDVETGTVVITHYEKTNDWGCIEVDTRTWVKDVNTKRIDNICGKIGSVGDTVAGFWVDSWDDALDGFRYNKP